MIAFFVWTLLLAQTDSTPVAPVHAGPVHAELVRGGLEPTEPVVVTAHSHPDPDSLREGVALEVVARVDLGTTTASDLGSPVLTGPYAQLTGTLDDEGRVRFDYATDLQRVDGCLLRLYAEHEYDPPLSDAARTWAWPVHMSSTPLPGYSVNARVRTEGAGPWRVDLGTLAVEPAPLVVALELARDERPIEAAAAPIGLRIDVGSGKYPLRSPRFELVRDEPLHLYSWEVDPTSTMDVWRDDDERVDGLQLWCPRFAAGSRVRTALVPHRVVTFECEPSEATPHFALLVPTDRMDDLGALERLPATAVHRSVYAYGFQGLNGRPGHTVHVSERGADTRPVPPSTFEVVVIDRVESASSGVRGFAFHRLGPVDLREPGGDRVRIALDLRNEVARVVEPAPDAGPLQIEVVAELPDAGAFPRYTDQVLVTAHDPKSWRQRDVRGIAIERGVADADGRLHVRLELREVRVGEELVVRLFPRLGDSSFSLPVYDRPAEGPFGEFRTAVDAVGPEAVLRVDLGTIHARPAPALGTLAFEADERRPLRFAVRRRNMGGAFRSPIPYAWFESETNRMVTLYSWLAAPLDPGVIVVDADGLGPTQRSQLPVQGWSHTSLPLHPEYRLCATPRDEGAADLDGWALVLLPYDDHFPVVGRAPYQNPDDERQRPSYDERREFRWLESGSELYEALEPRTVLELWRFEQRRTPGGAPTAVLEIDPRTDPVVELGPWRITIEAVAPTATVPAAQPRDD